MNLPGGPKVRCAIIGKTIHDERLAKCQEGAMGCEPMKYKEKVGPEGFEPPTKGL